MREHKPNIHQHDEFQDDSFENKKGSPLHFADTNSPDKLVDFTGNEDRSEDIDEDRDADSFLEDESFDDDDLLEIDAAYTSSSQDYVRPFSHETSEPSFSLKDIKKQFQKEHSAQYEAYSQQSMTLSKKDLASNAENPNALPWDQLEQGTVRWEDFSHHDKEKIIKHFAPKIRYIALRIKVKLPKNIELSELISAGTLGLLEALGKFKPQLSIRFDTYAESRIRGAMIDELRRLDWFPRSLRAKVRQLDNAAWRIENEKGRTATTAELASFTGFSEKEVSQGLEALQSQLCISLDAIQDSIASDSSNMTEDDPYQSAAFLEMVEKVSHIIETLTPREKLVLSLYYNDELNMREASEVMEITEGRVSQLHTQAITRLRRNFLDQYGDSLDS